MILRYTFLFGISVILSFISQLSIPNACIIFKMYDTNKIGNGKDSHIGHTVAIFKYNNKISYVDPQAEKGPLDINQGADPSIIANDIKQLYGSPNWQYIDIIMTVNYDPFPEGIPQTTAKQLVEEVNNSGGNIEILTRTPDINYGGVNIKNKKSNKKISKKRTLKKNRKNIKNKKRNNKKTSKKYYGGNFQELDEFEELMIQIDKKYNTPTTLDTILIKDIN